MSFTNGTSPVVLSQYDPTGQYLCYVSIALDKQKISVEPVNKTQNDSLLNENALLLDNSNLKVTCLQWSFLSNNETLCVFIGLNNGEIWLYSPLANEIVVKISTENSYEIKDLFIFSNKQLWCIDSNDYIYYFDLTEFQLVDKFKLDGCSQLNKILVISDQKLLLASHQIFLVHIVTKECIMTYPGHISPVNNLRLLNNDTFISGAQNDRFLNVYDLDKGSTKSVLVAQSDIVKMVNDNETAVAIITENGIVELFVDPLINSTNKRRALKSKQASRRLKLLQNAQNGIEIPIIDIFIQKDTLNVMYLQNATIPYFHQIIWKQWTEIDNSVSLNISTKKFNQSRDRTLHGQDIASVVTYKEGNVSVTAGDNFKHVEELIKDWELETKELENDRSNDENHIAIESLADKVIAISGGDTHKKSKKKGPVTGTVTIILSQALQSNDHSLLENALNNRDERIIRDTIIRLKPSLSVILLERLAERIARQTHRQGALNVWVKWCLIIHGGYLVTTPNLLKTLSSLHSTLRNRGNTLNRLLALETRLDISLNRLKINNTPDETLYGDEEQEIGLNIEDEDDVEYNEELDDAGLIEDGEDGISEDSSEEDFEEEDMPSSDDSKYRKQIRNNRDDMKEHVLVSGVDEVEEGYSDVEMS